MKLIDHSYRKRRPHRGGTHLFRTPYGMPRSAPVSPSSHHRHLQTAGMHASGSVTTTTSHGAHMMSSELDTETMETVEETVLLSGENSPGHSNHGGEIILQSGPESPGSHWWTNNVYYICGDPAAVVFFVVVVLFFVIISYSFMTSLPLHINVVIVTLLRVHSTVLYTSSSTSWSSHCNLQVRFNRQGRLPLIILNIIKITLPIKNVFNDQSISGIQVKLTAMRADGRWTNKQRD